jgi:Dolichyl-phosphate-mannose-protein mannosyltransferase
MVAAGRVLSGGYFDHPPASWWLSWAGAHVFGTEAPIAVRFPFIALFALSTWLMFRITAAVADDRAGFWAAVLLNLSPVFGVTAGTWVLPDGPLLGALLGATLCLVHALDAGAERPSRVKWWIGAGLCAGLAMSAKYSAVLSIGGAFLFLLCDRRQRHWLRRPEPYLAILIALLAFAPVVIWNAAHGWASFAFQGERAMGLRFRPLMPLTTLLGEGLFVLPWIWAPMLVLLVRDRRRLLAFLAAPPIVGFALISAWSSQRILFHWAAPGYLMLFPALGQAVVERLDRGWVRRTIVGTAVFVITALIAIGAQTRFDILGDRAAALMRKDPTMEGIDWTSIRDDLTERGLLRPGVIVGVGNWRDGGKIAYALGPDVTVVCLNADARQFGFAQPPAAFIGQDMLLIGLAPVTGPFTRIEPLPPTAIRLRGRVLATIAVSLGHRLTAWPPPVANDGPPR